MKISVSPRDLSASKFKMRKQDLIPGIIYSKNKNEPVVISQKELSKALSAHEPIMETTQGDMVVIKEIQKDPISQKAIHVSFQEITKGQKFTTKIPLIFETNGVNFSSQGKILKTLTSSLEVKTTSEAMVDHISVDVSTLKVHEVLRLKDIAPIKGIEFLDDSETQLAVLDYIRQEEEEEKPVVATSPAEVPLVKPEVTTKEQ